MIRYPQLAWGMLQAVYGARNLSPCFGYVYIVEYLTVGQRTWVHLAGGSFMCGVRRYGVHKHSYRPLHGPSTKLVVIILSGPTVSNHVCWASPQGWLFGR